MSFAVFVPPELRDVVRRVEAGETPRASVRELLRWFSYERRGSNVVSCIRSALEKHNLITKPNFAYAWIDERVTFVKYESGAEQVTTTTTAANLPVSVTEADIAPATDIVAVVSEDPTYRIGKLDAANKPPRRISPDALLNEAITIMLRNDYSQLPVMTSDREVKGAITWKSISVNLTLGLGCRYVRDCMEKNVEIVAADVSLFRVIDLIAEQDFVLVRDAERRISGIVTVADLGQSFHLLGRPFLLLSEIENHIRGLLDGRFSQEELNEIRTPGDEAREINDVSNLNFGEYVRLLQKPERWERIGLQVDRATFVKDLEVVNRIRNDVMHFDPDGISPDDLDDLRKMSRFLQQLRNATKR